MRNFFVLVVGFLVTLHCSHGQQNHLMYFKQYLPQANYHNPAYQSPCLWWIGIPVLSSVHANYANSIFSFNNLFPEGLNNTRQLNLDDRISKLNRNNFMGLELHTTLFGLGYRRNSWYFNFMITEKLETDLFVSRAFADLAWNGNASSIGETIHIKNTGLFLNYYREFAFGLSKHINEKWLIGGKAKILFGKLSISNSQSFLDLSTSEHEYYIDIFYDLEINTSLPLSIETNANNQFESASLNTDNLLQTVVFNRNNPGLAFDFGMVYNYNSKIKLHASLIDLGFIRWRSNLNTLENTNTMSFRGLTSNSEFNIATANYFADTIELNVNQDKYFKVLPAKFYLGLQYQLSNIFHANFLLTSKYYPEKWVNTSSIIIDAKPRHWLSLSTGYTLQYGSYNNVGFGFTLGRNPIQFYAYTDNLVGLIWPLTAQNINVRFGININLGCKNKSETDAEFFGSQVPCPDIRHRQNSYKQKIERKKKR